MDLDTLARAATLELLELPTPDPAAGFTTLKRTRTRRTVTRATGAAAALLLALGTWQLHGAEDQRPEPAPRPAEVTNGSLLAPAVAGVYQYSWRTVLGEPLEHMPEELARDSLIQFTADGSELVYADKTGNLVVRDLTAGSDRHLVDCLDTCVGVLSPDGRTVAYAGSGGLQLQDVSDARVRPIELDLGRVGTPQWSPDGATLAFSSADGLHTVAVDGSDLRLVHRATEPGDLFTDVAWSPDGSRIAFFDTEVLQRQSGIPDVRYTAMTVARDGSSPTVLHQAGHCFCVGASPPTVTWSPDGRLIVVGTTGMQDRSSGLYTVRTDGSDWQKVAVGWFARPAWQPITR